MDRLQDTTSDQVCSTVKKSQLHARAALITDFTGFGSGAKNWIVHLEGGGWCINLELCVTRSRTVLGSSNNWWPSLYLDGFLSDSALSNPDFYNWNVAFINYCDGASFAGYRYDPLRCV